MKVFVYRLRRDGFRVQGRRLREEVFGQLVLVPSPPDSYGPRMQAHVRDENGGDLAPILYWARVRRIDGVLHLAGKEEHGRHNTKARVFMKKQSWLCAQTREEAQPLLDRIKLNDDTAQDDEEDEDETYYACLTPTKP